MLLVILTGCSSGTCECPDCFANVDKAAVAAEIAALGISMEEALMTQDKEAFMSYYGEGVISSPPGSPAIVGKDVIRQRLEKQWAEPNPPGMSFNMEQTDLWVLGDYVVEMATYTFNMEGMDEPEVGKLLNFYEKQDGKYKVIRDIWNTDTMPEAPIAEAEAEVE
jgi:ketosteroid isomerase-like protein